MSRYVLLAGPNGVGKSTIYGLTPDMKGITYINLDKLEKHSSGKQAVSIIEDCFAHNASMVRETTLCGRTIVSSIERALDAGYEVIIHFIGIESEDICRKRIKSRVARGGHNISDTDLHRRFSKSYEQVRKLIPVCSELYFYDNTEYFKKVAKYSAGKEVWHAANLPQWYVNLITELTL